MSPEPATDRSADSAISALASTSPEPTTCTCKRATWPLAVISPEPGISRSKASCCRSSKVTSPLPLILIAGNSGSAMPTTARGWCREMAGPVGLPFTMSPKTTEPTVPWKVMWLLPKRIDTPSRSITSLSPL